MQQYMLERGKYISFIFHLLKAENVPIFGYNFTVNNYCYDQFPNFKTQSNTFTLTNDVSHLFMLQSIPSYVFCVKCNIK